MHPDRSPENRPLHVADPGDALAGAGLLAVGTAIAHGFGNFYAITARGDAASVRRVNVMKGRPPEQVGSVTLPPSRITEIFDWDALPAGLSRACVSEVFDAFFELGPFGFRGPAHPLVADQLTSMDGAIRTTQVISPGYRCPSNHFLELAAAASGDDLLYVTSANRSRHLTGADDTPAHWHADALRAEFDGEPNLVVLEHANEAVARSRYPWHMPMSTSILGFHRANRAFGRPSLVLERHGSLYVDHVRSVLDSIGLGLVIGPCARTRLALRSYPVRPQLESIRRTA